MRLLEIQLIKTLSLSTEQLLKLRGHNREYFNIDSVEFIEASPCTRGGKTFEELGNHEVVHTIRTVEYDTLLSKSFCKIFGRFRFTSSGWSSWSTSQVKIESTHKCHIALISEWSDDKTERVAKILVTIWIIGLDTFDPAVLLFPVVSKLRDPLEASDVIELQFDKSSNDILCMYINSDESTHCDTL
jgi:hypothetical protein